MTPEEASRIRANFDLFVDELGEIPNFDRILPLLDRFARILSPEDAEALAALIKIVAPDPEYDEDESDDERDPDEGAP